MKITCYTIFDITKTNITRRCTINTTPFIDNANQTINSVEDWNKSRNQQRNWETLTQVLSLRTQLLNITDPEVTTHNHWPNQTVWTFSFEVEFPDIFTVANDKLGLLLQDINQVPMIVHLNESVITCNWLSPYTPTCNIIFI